MSGKRYPEEFHIEAVKQVTARGYKVGEVAQRLGVAPKSLHDWIKRYGDESSQHQTVTAQQASARQPEAQINLGNLHTGLGEIERAAEAYKTAIDINQGYVPGYVNLADPYRRQGNEARAEDILRKGVEVIRGSAAIHHALGLSLVRQ